MATPSFSILRKLIDGGEMMAATKENSSVAMDTALPAGAGDTGATPSAAAEKTPIIPAAPTVAVVAPSPKAVPAVVAQPTSSTASPKANVTPPDHFLKILAENAPVAMAIFDSSMKYLYANQRWMEFFKLEQTEVVGRSQYEVFPALHPGWRHVYERALNGQVVRSDRDTVNQAGRPVLYRWEVRPWRNAEAEVSGVMITCLSIPGVQSKDVAEGAVAATPVATPEAGLGLWELPLPIMALDGNGLVCRWSKLAGNLFTADGLKEGEAFFWELFGNRDDTVQLRSATLNAVHRAAAGEQDLEALTIPKSPGTDLSKLPGNWHLVTLSENAADSGAVMLAIGLPRVEVPVPVMMTPSEPAADPEVERLLRQREARLRSVLDVAPCGLVVLDEQGRPVFHNVRAAALLGRSMREGQSMEDWLAQSSRDEKHREEVVRLWREGVWRKQLTRVLTLTAADAGLKEIELRPASIPGGGMLVMLNDVTDDRRAEELLRAIEAKFRALVHENPLPIVLSDRSGSVFEANAAAEEMTGRTRGELRSMPLSEWLAPDSLEARAAALRELTQRGGFSQDLPVSLSHREGHSIPAELRLATVQDASGQPASTIHFFQPVEEKAASFMVEAEEAREQAMESFLKLPANVVLLATDYHGRISEWSDEAVLCFGLRQGEALGRGLHTLFRPSDASGFYSDLQTLTAAGVAQPVEWMFLHPDHGRRTGRFMLQPAEVGGMAVAILGEDEEPMDAGFMAEGASEAESAELAVKKPDPAQQLERERYLVGETHHRVKNHLQIITSMLNLQLSLMQDGEAREALRSSQNRVRSIADLHQHLFGVAVGEGGEFGEFAEGLIGHLRNCYDISPERVRIDLDVANAAVPEEWLMPLALSLNEMVSNAFKHAFPDDRSGSLKIVMQWNPAEGELRVEDDGVGMPEDYEQRHFTGLGMKILRVFAGQLGGEVRIQSEPGRGCNCRLIFPQAS